MPEQVRIVLVAPETGHPPVPEPALGDRLHHHERDVAMTSVAQDAFERRRDDALAAFEHLREPFGVMHQRTGDVVALIVGDRGGEDFANAFIDRIVETDATEVSEANEDHGGYSPTRMFFKRSGIGLAF
jgi:hypothetical protein